MLQVTNKKIKDETYNSLILYALLRCDAFTFKIPDFYSKISSNTRSEEFLNYKKNIEWRMEEFQKYLIKDYTSAKYFGSIGENYSEIKVMSLNIDVIGSLLATDGLYSWLYPNMPEDLCLFSKGKCWLRSIAHEKLCFIYTDSEIEIDILKKVIGLKFVKTEDTEIPMLNLDIQSLVEESSANTPIFAVLNDLTEQIKVQQKTIDDLTKALMY